MDGTVIMKRTTRTGTDILWTAWDPDGNALPYDVNTDSFGPAHAYALANLCNLYVDGGAISPTETGANVMNFPYSTRMVLGPGDMRSIIVRGVSWNFIGFGLTSGAAVTVDSYSKGNLHFDGQLVCAHRGAALEFRPSTYYTGDAGKNSGVSEFFWRIIQQANTQAGDEGHDDAVVVKFNAQNGESLNGSHYRILEVNGGNVGAQFITAGTGVIVDNTFKIWGVHGYSNVGIDTTAAQQMMGCTMDVSVTSPQSANYTAKIGTRACPWRIMDKTAGYKTKLHVHSWASGNEIRIFAPNGTGLELTNNAGTNNRIWYNNDQIV